MTTAAEMTTAVESEAIKPELEVYPNMPTADRKIMRRPNMLVRVVGWLLRPLVWEAMRQHPGIDYDRLHGAPLLGLWQQVTGRNRTHGFGS